MTQLFEPIRHDVTLYLGTDQVLLKTRRFDTDIITPTSGKAQIRSRHGGALWLECTVTVDVDGWVTVSVPEESTTDEEWANRSQGVWDLEVVVEGNRLRWAEGNVKISQEVTRG